MDYDRKNSNSLMAEKPFKPHALCFIVFIMGFY